MSKDIFKELADSIAARPNSHPVINCPEFVELLEELFSPEEAELAIVLPVGSNTVEKIASVADRSAEEVLPLLESMADQGLVFIMERKGDVTYKLMEVVPGFFEFQFMKGESTERDKKVSVLFKNYFDKIHESSLNIPEPMKRIAPFSRVISVEREVEAGTVVHPYETVSEYIDNAEYISVSQCYCRHHGELLGDPCKFPKEVCLSFGPNAKFIAERGFGRMISKNEAYKILDKTEELGLVHISSNTTKYVEYICNCCPCHCGILKSLLNVEMPSMAAISNFELIIDEENCIGCGECAEKCPAGALEIEDDLVHVDVYRCIGCGVCTVACPSGALSMERRDNSQEPPYDNRELQQVIMKSVQDAINKINE